MEADAGTGTRVASTTRAGVGDDVVLGLSGAPGGSHHRGEFRAGRGDPQAAAAGWHVGGAEIASGHARFWLNSDQAGDQALTFILTAACDTSGARQIPSDQPGTRRFERPLSPRPQFTGLRFYLFPGGCVTYRFTFTPGASPLLAIPAGSAAAFTPRATLVEYIKNTEDLALCGRGAPCPDEPAGRTLAGGCHIGRNTDSYQISTETSRLGCSVLGYAGRGMCRFVAAGQMRVSTALARWAPVGRWDIP
jgi:hypothetical protein